MCVEGGTEETQLFIWSLDSDIANKLTESGTWIHIGDLIVTDFETIGKSFHASELWFLHL